MKTIVLFLGILVLFASCKKESKDNTNKIEKDSAGIILSITNYQWYSDTEKGPNIGAWRLFLVISGNTNADKVTVETYGDGLTGEFELPLDENKNFYKDTVGIAFFMYSTPPTGQFEKSTIVTAVSGNNTLKIPIKSGLMNYK